MKSRVVVEVIVEDMSSGSAAWLVQERLAKLVEVSRVDVMASDEIPERLKVAR